MKKKIAIMVTILLLAIGFAIVSTTLVINGNINVGNGNFEVIFTDAILDDVNIYDTNALSEDKKTIIFTSSDLKNIKDTSKLKYEITNKSEKASATIDIKCTPDKQEYTSISNVITSGLTTLDASDKLTGEATITLNKAVTFETTERYECKIVATRNEN